MLFPRIGLFILLASLLGACSRTAPSAAPSTPSHGWERSELSRERARFAKAQTQKHRGIDVASYAVKGHFDWEKLRLFATVDIELKVVADSLDKLVLDNRTEVKAVNGANGPLAFSQADEELTIAASGKKDETIKLSIVYEASANAGGERGALNAVLARKGDPLSARVVATMSEPLAAIDWLPCHDDPRDRATFAIEMSMPEAETMIANGDLHKNDVVAGVRTMAYSTKFTLPNYLMAFAVGEFSRYAALHGRKTVGIWARKGLPIDVPAVLSTLNRTMSTYERLLGDYPFEQYVIVLLPEYGGGIENAGITFQGETQSTRGDLSSDLELTGHELGHQWFGDYVTVDSWDDLWIKEGMATLLAAEAEHFAFDPKEGGSLGGSQFEMKDGDRIRDTALPPDDKYTSGPYGRAAWTLTQVRAVIGEKNFWTALRSVLQEYAYGSVSTEQFLAHFQPYLPANAIDRWRKALSAKQLPHLRNETGSLGQNTLIVDDPDAALLTPLELRWLDDSDNVTNVRLYPAQDFGWGESDSRLLLLEPRDITALPQLPGWQAAVVDSGLVKKLVPRSERQRSEFADQPTPSQTYAVGFGDGWTLEAASFGKLVDSLGSESAKYSALQLGCAQAKLATSDNSRTAWKNALLASLGRPPFLGLPSSVTRHGLSECRDTLGEDFLRPVWEGVLSAPTDKRWNETILTFAFLFSTEPDKVFEIATKLASEGPSVRARRLALQQLQRHLDGTYPAPNASALPGWTAYLREQVKTVTVGELLQPLLKALQAAHDGGALPVLATTIPGWSEENQARGVCAAKRLAGEDSAAWDAFVKGLGDTARFSHSIRRLLSGGAGC